MNKAMWIVRKNYLCVLIRQVSTLYGGDEIDFLREHCKAVISTHKGIKIEEAIACYEQIKASF